jgi:hypothetical protein
VRFHSGVVVPTARNPKTSFIRRGYLTRVEASIAALQNKHRLFSIPAHRRESLELAMNRYDKYS